MSDPVRTPPPGFDELPSEEQIEYVQALWDRVAADPSRVPVPEWHLQELQRRAAAHQADPAAARPWAEVRERLRRWLDPHA